MSTLTKEQSVQEDQYEVPYHWFFKEDEFRGRNYFGYCRATLKFAEKYGFEPKSMSALDAGCGDARFTKMLIDHGVKEVSGLDYSERSLAFARIFLPKVLFEVKDLTDQDFTIPVKHNSVFLIETLEHIDPKDISLFIKNLAKCLKDDGLLLITVPSVLLSMHDKHYQHFTMESLSKCVETDFEVLEIVGYNSVRQPLLTFAYKLIHNRLWDILPLRSWFNTKIWPKYQCLDSPEFGKGLLLVARKKK